MNFPPGVRLEITAGPGEEWAELLLPVLIVSETSSANANEPALWVMFDREAIRRRVAGLRLEGIPEKPTDAECDQLARCAIDARRPGDILATAEG
jgi:hypothetical protein